MQSVLIFNYFMRKVSSMTAGGGLLCVTVTDSNEDHGHADVVVAIVSVAT